MTREKWLSAPSRLPPGLPERKLLFFLDDLNRKVYASRVEQVPNSSETIFQPLNNPLQKRLYETLEVFETLCGRNEIYVIATARDEKYVGINNEPSEWDKLEFQKYKEFWRRFQVYSLPEADDSAEVNLLIETTRRAEIIAEPKDFQLIAEKNDGTFSNLVENMRTVNMQNIPLRISTFRETLRGTWSKRYQDVLQKYPHSKYVYDAVELARSARLNITFLNVLLIASTLSGKGDSQLSSIENFQTLQYLIKHENILIPRDGQIEAKGYKLQIEDYLSLLSKVFYLNHYVNHKLNIKITSLPELVFIYLAPIQVLSDEEITKWWIYIYIFGGLPWTLHSLGYIFHNAGFPVYAEKLYNKSILMKKPKTLSTFRLNKRLSVTWNNLGYACLDQGKYEVAVQAFRNATELNSKDPVPWVGLGIVYGYQRRFEEAFLAYRKAISLEPQNGYYWNKLGDLYLMQNQYDEAVENYKRAIELDPKMSFPWYGLGEVYYGKDQYEDAIESFQNAIKLDPKNPYPWVGLGKVYCDYHQYDNAFKAYQKALGFTPKDSYLWYLLGRLYFNNEKYEDAIIAYNRSCELNPNNPYPWMGLSSIFLHQEKYHDALVALQKATELDPADEYIWHRLGILYLKMSMYNEAVTVFRKAIDHDNTDARAWHKLGISYRFLMDLNNALYAFELALSYAPNKLSIINSIISLKRKFYPVIDSTNEEIIAQSILIMGDEYDYACFEMLRGNIDEALRLFEISCEKKQASLLWVSIDPILEEIREDPRFREIYGYNS